ncbi:carbohydrate binding domain-containing protein [Hymenobacter sp. BT664]|uniref:Carbohydrate binding domain-containing protein n=1 Tax=Hymenobacter montanus TaxID=2771359 RepID=A0A927BB25_9BACT|nr:carbohydrate binding domain-containing protein [Hymenobacter montanus]MBD2766889.1 carbohydrate binding domain-containing protein [Hymenobacter montanus]
MKKNLYVLLLLGMMASSCNKSDSTEKAINLLASNDFESLEGWVGETPYKSLTKERAHSGQFSIRVGPDVEYSNGYSNELSKLSLIKLNKIRVQGWVYLLPGSSPATLVIEVMNPGEEKHLLWEGVELAKATQERNHWAKIEKVITLPPDIKPTNRLRVYLWSAGSQTPAYIDDLQIIRVL